MQRTKNPGTGTNVPSQSCDDPKCPFHGNLKVRGKLFTGTVVSGRMQRSVIVEWTGWKHVPKYERYKKTRTRVIAHNPKCVDAKEGDVVRIGECRPLSKTKNFVVLEIKGQEKAYELKKEAAEEAKHKAKAKEDANKAKQAAKKGAEETATPDSGAIHKEEKEDEMSEE